MPAFCGAAVEQCPPFAPDPTSTRGSETGSAWFREARAAAIGRAESSNSRNNPRKRGVVGAISQPENREERTMNWDRVEGNWKTFKGQVQQKWGKLTDDDLDVIEGKRTELAGRLQQRYGYARDEAEKNIDTWLRNIH
jgi:uncharacterized protein YjbJ (UPF0337 family)